MIRRIVVTALACAFLLSSNLAAEARSPQSVADWREDLDFLEQQLPKTHARLFHTVKPELLSAMFDELRAAVPKLTDNQIAVGVMRIMAAIGDGHTLFEIWNPKAGFRILPIRLYPFSDGLFVRATLPAYRELLGKRVTHIGSVPVAEAVRRATEVIPRDNARTIESNLPMALALANVLNGLDVTPSDREAVFTVDDDGKPRSVTVKAIEFGEVDKSQWLDARAASPNATPLYLEDATYTLRNPWTKFYWFKHLPERKALYIKYNAVANAEDESVAAFFERAYRFADQNSVEKLVLDLRNNGGGNNQLNLPIVHGIIKRDAINRRGRLFVIIGRETFSAAQNAANLLEKHTNAIFVGEPTGGRPNHFGDSARITLPKSRWSVRASTLWWQDMDPRDRRPWIAPEIAVDVSSADYLANRDPVLEAVFNAGDVRRLSERLDSALKSGGAEAAIREFRSYLADPRHKYASVEDQVNSYGYRLLLTEKRLDDAIVIFKLNAEAHPNSWNAHDSLAEAYAAKGKKELAIQSYERAAKLNPERLAIREAIEALRK